MAESDPEERAECCCRRGRSKCCRRQVSSCLWIFAPMCDCITPICQGTGPTWGCFATIFGRIAPLNEGIAP
eukprot:3268108-Rhodomonas_salina.1